MKRVNTKRAIPRFRQILLQSLFEFERRIRTSEIRNAEQADEAAAEIAGNIGYSMTSKAGEELLAALYKHAGKSFPGAWEDYPKTPGDLLDARSSRASLLG
jgi:hypothetical protein